MARIFRFIATVFFGAFAVGFGAANALEQPVGKVILTISGKIAERNQGAVANFDLAMLEKLPQQTFTTLTPWYPNPVKFQGPLLRDVLAAVKATKGTLKALALNDYQTSIPFDDATQFDVIIAHHMDGEPIPVRTKGPLFIVYPYDSKESLRTSVYYERSAWQLKSLAIE
jgi:hypothetical protein